MYCGSLKVSTQQGRGLFCVGPVYIGIGIGFGVNVGTVLFAPHLTNMLTDFNQFCMDFTFGRGGSGILRKGVLVYKIVWVYFADKSHITQISHENEIIWSH